ncbi:MAG: histidine kinase N-terminal 7TM domain-containing protein, partial [bacterium]
MIRYLSLFFAICIDFLIIAFGYIAFRKNKSSITTQLFFLFTTTFSLWLLFNFLETWVESVDLAVLFFKLDFIVAPIFVFAMVSFAVVFPTASKRFSSYKKIFYFFIPGLIASFLAMINQVVGNIAVVDHKITFSEAAYFPVYAAVILISLFVIIGVLICRYRKERGFERSQIKYLALGIFMTFSILAIVNLFFQTKLSADLFRMSNFSSIFLVGFTTYAIVRHRLMDIRFILKKSSVYIALIGTVLVFNFLVKGILGGFLIEGTSSAGIDVIVLLGIVLGFPYLKDFYFDMANKYFFSSLYDERSVIAVLSDNLKTTLNIKEVYDYIFNALNGALHLKVFGILVWNDPQQSFKKGMFDHVVFDIQKFPQQKKIRSMFDKEGKIIVVSEQKRKKTLPEELVNYFNKLGIEAIALLEIKDEMVGLLLLGEKESSDMYNTDDIQLLETVGSQGAIAISNAVLYGEAAHAYAVERKAREDLEALNQAKTDFILTTQHHLRTPLTIVKGVANMFEHKEKGYVLSDTDTAFLGKLSSGANKLAKLINDFLDISQMEVGKSILNKQQTSLHPLIEETITELSHEIEQKQLHVETTFTEEAKETTLSI